MKVNSSIMEVSLEWLRDSDHHYAQKFRLVASQIHIKECPACAMFFEDEGSSLVELQPLDTIHFQEIVDSIGLSVKIVSVTNDPVVTKPRNV